MKYLKNFILFLENVKLDKDEFIKLANKKFNKLYSYVHANYKNINEPIRIECKKHGPFNIKPLDHLKGKGCPDCFNNNTPDKIANVEGYDLLTKVNQPAFYQKSPKLPNGMIRRN